MSLSNLSALLIFQSTTKSTRSISTLPPLGILSIAAHLEQKGIRADVIDYCVENTKVVDHDEYDVIGFSANISNVEKTLESIASIHKRDPKKTIVVGGPLCMSNPEIFIDQGAVDAIFVCEGEEALFEYMTWPQQEDVKGLYLKRNDHYELTGDRAWIGDLDALPFPALQKVDVSQYRSVPSKRRPITSLMTSRGCPFRCIFCSHSMGSDWRPRSAENVVEEIRWQVEDLGVKEVCVYDDNFSLDTKRASRICDLLMEGNIQVRLQFTNGLRVDCLNDGLLRKLKDAGTWMIGIAPETGNAEIMKRIRKGFRHDRVLEIREACRRLHITTFGFFMIGFPFETRETIEDTISFAKKLDCEIVEFNKVIPYARTELYDIAAKEHSLLPSHGVCLSSSYHDGEIKTHRVGDLSPSDIKTIITRAYRRYYLRPRKILDLLEAFSPWDLLTLARYAVLTGNI